MTPSNLLRPGDRFPTFSVDLVGGDTLELPSALAGRHAVVLLFRGAWCPYCNAQLRAFERARERLERDGVSVVALSVDDEVATRQLIDKHRLGFPVGHSADAEAIGAATGAFVHEEPEFLEST